MTVNSIANENITFITEDSKYNIWIATVDGIVNSVMQLGLPTTFLHPGEQTG